MPRSSSGDVPMPRSACTNGISPVGSAGATQTNKVRINST
jgi:hypothetical protein